MDWLGNNADKSIEELKEAEEDGTGILVQPGEQARSLLCKDCGKKFRSMAAAEFHANKTYVPTSQPPAVHHHNQLTAAAIIKTSRSPPRRLLP